MSNIAPTSPPGLSASWEDHVITLTGTPKELLAKISMLYDIAPFDIPTDAISRRLLSKYHPQLELPPIDMMPKPYLDQAFVELVHEKLADAERQASPEEIGFYMPKRMGFDVAKLAVDSHHDKDLIAYKDKKMVKEFDDNVKAWMDEIGAMLWSEMIDIFFEIRQPRKRMASDAFGDELDIPGPCTAARDMIARYALTTSSYAAAVRMLKPGCITLQLLQMKCSVFYDLSDRVFYEPADAMARRYAESRHEPSKPEALKSPFSKNSSMLLHGQVGDDAETEYDPSEIDEEEFGDFDPSTVSIADPNDLEDRDDLSSIFSSCHDDDSDSKNGDDDDDEAPAAAMAVPDDSKVGPSAAVMVFGCNNCGHMINLELALS